MYINPSSRGGAMRDYLWTLVKAYNPNQYDKLLERRGHEFLVFMALTLVFCMILFTILLIPVTYKYISSIPGKTAEVEQLELSAQVKADHQVTLLDRPQIILDTSANTTRTGEFTITNDGVMYPKYLFFGTSMMRWSEVRDLKQQTPTRDRALTAFIIFILPSIIFWFFLFQFFKLGLIFLLLCVLGYAIPKAFQHGIRFADSAKVAVLAMPSLMVMDLALYPLAPLFWWGLVLTSVFFFVGIALISEVQTLEHRRHKV